MIRGHNLQFADGPAMFLKSLGLVTLECRSAIVATGAHAYIFSHHCLDGGAEVFGRHLVLGVFMVFPELRSVLCWEEVRDLVAEHSLAGDDFLGIYVTLGVHF